MNLDQSEESPPFMGVIATRDIKKGEELTSLYNEHAGNQQLFNSYGFTIEENPNDAMTIPICSGQIAGPIDQERQGCKALTLTNIFKTADMERGSKSDRDKGYEALNELLIATFSEYPSNLKELSEKCSYLLALMLEARKRVTTPYSEETFHALVPSAKGILEMEVSLLKGAERLLEQCVVGGQGKKGSWFAKKMSEDVGLDEEGFDLFEAIEDKEEL